MDIITQLKRMKKADERTEEILRKEREQKEKVKNEGKSSLTTKQKYIRGLHSGGHR